MTKINNKNYILQQLTHKMSQLSRCLPLCSTNHAYVHPKSNQVIKAKIYGTEKCGIAKQIAGTF